MSSLKISGKRVFAAVGQVGAAMYSKDDGSTWDQVTHGSRYMYGITYARQVCGRRFKWAV